MQECQCGHFSPSRDLCRVDKIAILGIWATVFKQARRRIASRKGSGASSTNCGRGGAHAPRVISSNRDDDLPLVQGDMKMRQDIHAQDDIKPAVAADIREGADFDVAESSGGFQYRVRR